MRHTFHMGRFVFVVAAMEMLFGLAMYAVPNQFDAPAYAPIRGHLLHFATLLVAGAVVMLLLQRYPVHPALRRILALMPAAPMILLAWLFGEAAIWTGAVHYGLLALALLLFPWLESRRDGVDLGGVVLGLIVVLVGGLMILNPSSFPPASYGSIQNALPLIGIAGLLSSVVLLAPLVRTDLPRRSPVMAIGAILPLVLAGNFLVTRIWTGMGWGIWGLSFLAEPAIRWVWFRFRIAPESEDEQGRELAVLERTLELWTWVLVLVVVALSATDSMNMVAAPLRSTIFVVVLALYNGLVYLIFPGVGKPAQRVLAHVVFFSLAVGYLLVGAQPVGLTMLTLLVVVVPIATRAAGAKVGRAMLLLALGVVASPQVVAWLGGRQSFSHTMVVLIFELLVVGTASWVGHAVVVSERRVVRALKESQAEVRRQVEKLSLLLRIADSVRGSLDLERIMTSTVAELGKALEVDRAYLRLLDSDQQSLRLAEEYTAPGVPPMMTGGPLPPSIVMESAGTVIFPDVESDTALRESNPRVYEFLLGVGSRSAMAAPLLVDGHILGVMGVQCSRPRQWSAEEIRFLEEVGTQVGVALALAQTHQALLRQYEELQATHHDLQSAHEELIAQEEELQALNDALKSSEARFASLLSIAPNAILAIDQSHRVIFFNRAATEIFGYESSEIEGELLDLLLPSSAVRTHRSHVEGFSTALPSSRKMGERMELAGRRKSGEEFPVEVAIARFRVNGEVYFTAVVEDVTERKRTERILRESEERFRSAFENAPIGVALMGGDGRWFQVNRALCEILGYDESELLALGVADLVHPEDREEQMHHQSALISGQSRSVQRELRYRHKDGHVVWVLQSCSAVQVGENPQSFITQMQDITDRKRYEASLIHLANHDPLTELINRRRFQEELESLLALTRNFSLRGALFFLDLDMFKYVNDTLGHHAGDDLLRRVAGLLRERLRETDVIARLGGDEFAILLPYTGDEAVVLAEQILEALRHERVVAGGQSLSVTGSIGITFFPEHSANAEELLAHADVAMYRAKEQGRNTYAVFSPQGDWKAQMESKLSWERRLRDALRANRFTLHYQPILDLRRNRITHHELLLRLVEDDGQVVLPGAFLGVAERYGLIYEIDRWVVREAIRILAEQRDRGQDLVFEVNLSGKTLSDPELLPMIQRELAAKQVIPSNLVFEITETAAISDLDQARRFIDAMKGLGCRFALDDVGAGFSSLYFLKHLAVDYIKIDGSFVRNLPNDPADQHLVKALVAVAGELGKKTVAEFVDNEETLRLLREYGVDYAQGFLLGRPGPMLKT